MESPRPWRRALAAAFPHTIPILTGYGFLGFTYGVYANAAGFPFWYPALTAAVVYGVAALYFIGWGLGHGDLAVVERYSMDLYGGSLEFVTVELLLSPFAPLATFFMALMIQARHLFYGLTMLDKYKGLGWKKPYLIYAMSDETFSLTCSADPPEGVDRGWFYFFITLLDQLYWIAAALLGGLAGSLLPFDTQGLDSS